MPLYTPSDGFLREFAAPDADGWLYPFEPAGPGGTVVIEKAGTISAVGILSGERRVDVYKAGALVGTARLSAAGVLVRLEPGWGVAAVLPVLRQVADLVHLLHRVDSAPRTAAYPDLPAPRQSVDAQGRTRAYLSTLRRRRGPDPAPRTPATAEALHRRHRGDADGRPLSAEAPHLRHVDDPAPRKRDSTELARPPFEVD